MNIFEMLLGEERRGGVTFFDCITECWLNDEFLRNIDRLRGTKLAVYQDTRSPIEALIDNVTNNSVSLNDFTIFMECVIDLVWERLPVNANSSTITI